MLNLINFLRFFLIKKETKEKYIYIAHNLTYNSVYILHKEGDEFGNNKDYTQSFH